MTNKIFLNKKGSYLIKFKQLILTLNLKSNKELTMSYYFYINQKIKFSYYILNSNNNTQRN